MGSSLTTFVAWGAVSFGPPPPRLQKRDLSSLVSVNTIAGHNWKCLIQHLARDENTASTVVTEIQHSTGVNINISISKGIRIRAQHPNKIGQRGAVKYGAW